MALLQRAELASLDFAKRVEASESMVPNRQSQSLNI